MIKHIAKLKLTLLLTHSIYHDFSQANIYGPYRHCTTSCILTPILLNLLYLSSVRSVWKCDLIDRSQNKMPI